MQGSTRRRPPARNGSVAGSVWESRMRVDAVNGGIKVFDGAADEGRDDESNAADEEGMRVYRRLRRNRSESIAATAMKRRSWTSPNAAVAVAVVETASALIDKSPIQLRKARSELSDSTRLSANAQKDVLLIGDGEVCGGGEKKMEGEEIEIEMAEEEKKSIDDKEMDERMKKPDDMETEEKEEEEKKISQIHEITVLPATAEKQRNPVTTSPSSKVERRQNFSPKTEDKQTTVATLSSPHVIKRQNPVIVQVETVEKKRNHVIDHRTLEPDPAKSAFEEAEETFDGISANHSRMQRIMDLIMWRDVSRTAFVFGLGTFFLISSTYAKDLNFSLISVASYAGLIFLAFNFVHKSILHRGETEYNNERYMMGEEEAIWFIRMLLPYVNELLFKLRSLFSGDPATTMKLAVLLFALARGGISITLWSLAKISTFWLERLRDGWESCNHKKAVAAAIFTLVWNMSSTVVRIWAVFMLVVAMRCYQQRIAGDWSRQQQGEEVVAEQGQDDSKTNQSQVLRGRHRQRGGTTWNEFVKERKIKKRN